jgi:phenylacetate-coenzyme A ligase PaaK-like adenylate-forming protein
MKLLSPAISRLARFRNWHIDQWIEQPIDIQREVLQDLVTHGQYTEFGRKHGLENTFTIRQYKERVPIHDYEMLKPYIERMMQGEENLLWNTPISWFAKSSGTTDKSKFLPVSDESLDGCHYNAGRDMVTLWCYNHPDTQLFTGKNLALGGSFKEDHFGEHNSFHGDVSAIIIQNLPMWADFFRAPDVSIALMDEWEAKLEKIALSMMDENVTSIAGVPSWMLVLVRRILEKKNKKDLREIWPNLEVYFHGGVSFTPYKEQFCDLFGNNKVEFLQLYNASEGFFGIQDQVQSDEMLLMLDYGIFYEFIEVRDMAVPDASRRTIQLEEVRTGIDYSMIITTNAGLWRYQLGDVIRFTSTNPYRFKISGRTRQHINVFGEELMVHNTDAALALACEKANARVSEYTVAPIFMSNNAGAHEWLIEFEKAPQNFDYFVAQLDEALKRQNSDYEAKRYNNYVLYTPVIRALPAQSFYKWLKKIKN